MADRLLDRITWPQDLKKISRAELPTVAKEMREFILDFVKLTGGHLGSGMGVIELTIALHYVYQFREDRLLFDVGHQAYPHKILTGRKAKMATIRQKGGLSGFTNREESPYDVYTTGHAGTAISSALGLAYADKLTGRSRHVVAVVGDAAMGCGVAFEAMNHGGALQPKLLVILNDNRWSIAKTVGALSSYLSKLRTGAFYQHAKKTVHNLIQNLPLIGEKVDRSLEQGLKILQNTLVPGQIFEALGTQYFGPIDGHNLDELLLTLERVKKLDGIVLLHVRTQKGKGVPGSQEKPDRAHAAKPQAPQKSVAAPSTAGTEPVVVKPSQPSATARKAWTDWFGAALLEAARKDERVIGLTAAMPDGTGVIPFMSEFPKRCLDAGIAEQHAVAFASGLATAGLKPVVAIYSTFLQRAYDQVFQEVLLNKVPVVFAMDRAGLVGEDGSSHNGVFDIAYLAAMPGMTLMAPMDGIELGMMLDFAISLEKPAALRFARGAAPGGEAREQRPKIELGRAEMLRKGRDLAIVAYGSEVEFARQSAEILERRGIEVEVWNARFAKPMDQDMVRSIRSRHALVLTVEDHAVRCGFGSLFLQCLHELPAGKMPRVCVLGVPDAFHAHSSRGQILAKLGLDAEGIAGSAQQELMLQKRSKGLYVVGRADESLA